MSAVKVAAGSGIEMPVPPANMMVMSEEGVSMPSPDRIGVPDDHRVTISDVERVTVSEVYITRAGDGGYDVLRQFKADVEYYDDAETHSIGTVTGWIGWDMWNEDIWEAADAISSDAEPLGAAAERVREQLAEEGLASVPSSSWTV